MRRGYRVSTDIGLSFDMRRAAMRIVSSLLVIMTCTSVLLPLSACAGTRDDVDKAGTSTSSASAFAGRFPKSILNDAKSVSQLISAGSSTQAQSQTSQGTVSATSASSQAASSATPASSGIIVIDAGHQASGDFDQEPIGPGATETKYRVSDGTQGSYTGVPECEVNLEVAIKLQADLEARGFTVYMVRTTNDVDISNAERAQYANSCGADLFIRLHCDGVDDSSVNGFLTLYPGENEFTGGIAAASFEAASIMHPIIVSELGATDRGMVARTDLSGFNWCVVPTVLFEMGVMSNYDDDNKLVDPTYQQLLADCMTDATVAYFQQRTIIL